MKEINEDNSSHAISQELTDSVQSVSDAEQGRCCELRLNRSLELSVCLYIDVAGGFILPTESKGQRTVICRRLNVTYQHNDPAVFNQCTAQREELLFSSTEVRPYPRTMSVNC